MSRIEQLKKFIAEDPTDPFPRYALALEYLRNDAVMAREVFRDLLTKFPHYLPTYYPAAQASAEAGDDSEAARIYKDGITLASKLGERKTEAELRQAHQQWLMEKP
jgi:predicted Zn-dependent protease